MNKTFIGLLVVGALLMGGLYAFNADMFRSQDTTRTGDYKNATYRIDGKDVTLKSGYAESEAAPGSASKVVTRYFGNELKVDLNGDKREDRVFLLTQSTGGSGTFYYVVAALDTAEGWKGSHGLLLGDRIAPQSTEVSQNPTHQGVVVVNYAVRASGEPMTTQPSVGKSIWLKFNASSMQWGEVAQNFEGEADPTRLNLGIKPWVWSYALYGDGRTITPKAGAFILTFGSDGKFAAVTDCNNAAGNYVVQGDALVFSDIYTTKKYCEGSLETEFLNILRDTAHHHFTSKGELILDIKFDSGSAVFR